MSSEATSVLTFSDLIQATAYKLGIAYYGSDGAGVPQIPVDAHDLFVCKDIVNKAIRMFIHDAPPTTGWRWLHPLGSVVAWQTVTGTITSASYNVGTGLTTLTDTNGTFYPSMEYKTITLSVAGNHTIVSYVTGTQITITGDFHTSVGQTYTVISDGNYTMNANFGGQYIGTASFDVGTNKGIFLKWVDEFEIRQWRSNAATNSGVPILCAVRPQPQSAPVATPRRRWEFITYPIAGQAYTIQFPYVLHFDYLVNLTDVQPAPFGHDETVLAACMAQAEKKVEDAIGGPDWQYYRDICLSNSYRVDAMSAAKTLGYCSNTRSGHGTRTPLEEWRENWMTRPIIGINP